MIEMVKSTIFKLNSEPKDQPPAPDINIEISNLGHEILYSEKLNRFYIGHDKPCTFDIAYKSSLKGPLVVRIMLISEKRPSEPLVRCHQHIKHDESATRHHVVLRLDGDATYVGKPEGMEYQDRLAMLIMMGNQGRKNVTLGFKCLSSCFNISRPSTALVFYFEDENDQELGRKVISIHISKNYERDMRAAENALMNRTGKKRSFPSESNSQTQTVTKKIMVADSSSSSSEEPNKLRFSIEFPPERCEVFKNILQNMANILAAQLYEAGEEDQTDIKLLHGEVKQKLSSLDNWKPPIQIKEDYS